MKNFFAVVGLFVVAKKSWEFYLQHTAMKKELEKAAAKLG